MRTDAKGQPIKPAADRYAPIPTEIKAVILEGNLLDRAIQNSPIPEISRYVERIGIVYKEWVDPSYDRTCPFCVANMIKYFRRKRDQQRTKEERLARQALLIPAIYRTEILLLEMVESAQATVTNGAMHYLAQTWTRHVNPNFRSDCENCLPFVLQEFKAMLPFLRAMHEKEEGPR